MSFASAPGDDFAEFTMDLGSEMAFKKKWQHWSLAQT